MCVRSRPTRSSPQLRPAGPTTQSGCSVASVLCAPTRNGASHSPTRRPVDADVVQQRGQRPEVVADLQALAQPGAPPVVDLHHVDDQVVVVERAEVGPDVVGGDLLEVAVPRAPHRRRRRKHDAGRGGEPVAVRRQRGLRVPSAAVLHGPGCPHEDAVVDQRRGQRGYVDRAGRAVAAGRSARRPGRPRARPRPGRRRAAIDVPGRKRIRCCQSSSGRRAVAPAGYQVAGLQLCQPSA